MDIKTAEIVDLEENARDVLRSIGGLTPEDAMNALGAAIAVVAHENWPQPTRGDLLDAWFSMVRNSVAPIPRGLAT